MTGTPSPSGHLAPRRIVPQGRPESIMVSEEDADLLGEFRIESLGHLARIEPLLLEIGTSGGDRRAEIVNEIFRAVHSVKGAAGFFGLTLIQTLSHAMEALLMQVRDGEIPFRPEMTDALRNGFDQLKPLLEALPETLDRSVDEAIRLLISLSRDPAARSDAAPDA